MLTRIFAVVAVMTLSGSAIAQAPDDLRGTWVLVSSVTDRDGVKTEQFGPGAVGMMTLDAAGHFMLTIIGSDLPRFSSNNRAGGTPEENRAVMSKSIAMIGTYLEDRSNKTLTFKVESSSFPNWTGTQQKRVIIGVSKDELKYITPTASSGGVGTVTWRRAN